MAKDPLKILLPPQIDKVLRNDNTTIEMLAAPNQANVRRTIRACRFAGLLHLGGVVALCRLQVVANRLLCSRHDDVSVGSSTVRQVRRQQGNVTATVTTTTTTRSGVKMISAPDEFRLRMLAALLRCIGHRLEPTPAAVPQLAGTPSPDASLLSVRNERLLGMHGLAITLGQLVRAAEQPPPARGAKVISERSVRLVKGLLEMRDRGWDVNALERGNALWSPEQPMDVEADPQAAEPQAQSEGEPLRGGGGGEDDVAVPEPEPEETMQMESGSRTVSKAVFASEHNAKITINHMLK